MDHVDVEACARASVEIVRRRSGGGAVLLEPHNVLWADVLIPVEHAMWTNDVSSSAWWLGEVWLHALASLGVSGLSVHRGAMRHSEWSRRVCFAGVGGGEVMLGERKVVGISQRRTRLGARFQCAVYARWRPDHVVALMADPRPSIAELQHVVAVVPMELALLRDAMVAALQMVG
jgi:lipoate-protein ligase A